MGFETLLYEESDGVAWVTLNRPEVHNAFNAAMQAELRSVWTSLRGNDEVRVAVLTGAGDKAFCTGVDRADALGDSDEAAARRRGTGSPFMFDDPGRDLGPKQCDLWKPVVAAVNGMACGGAFYLLGECDVLLAADHATFFDPHVTYGMTAAFEPIQLLQRMPFGEVLRLALLGNHERLSAQRAHQIGFVSEVCPAAELRERTAWVAAAIASAPPLAVQGTLRAIWAGQQHSWRQALDLAHLFVGLGNDPASLDAGQAAFASGRRTEWRLR